MVCFNPPGKNTGVDRHFLLQGIFPTQGSNSGLLYCRQILYPLSHQGSQSKWLLLLSCVQLLVTPWTAACQASLSFTVSQSSLKLMSVELVVSRLPTISSSVILFSCLQSFPASGSFQMSWLFSSGDQSIGASDSASVFLMNSQGWFPLGLTS